MPNFPDINPGAHTPVNNGFGMTAATPLDLRTIVTNLAMLDAMIAAHWMCEGMLVYDLDTKKYYQIYTNGQNQIDRKLFEIEASQIETATQADHLSHSISFNGGTAIDLSGNTVNINRLMPQLIENYAQDFDSKTTPGQYYGADGDSNNYLLTIEAIGDDKLIRTMTTIENGHIVVKQSIATKNGNVWTWGDWTLADGSVATAHILWVAPNAYVNVPGGSLAERWIYSDAGSQYPANAATVQTSDGQLFTIAAPPTAAIEHPFVVRLFSDGVTKTATVESLKATDNNFGKVKLSDATNDNSSGVNSGLAATPKAVASLDGRITKVNDSVAAGFSESIDYAVGDYVTYGFELYRCTTAHDAGDWNEAHFSKVTTTDELKAEADARETADTTLQTNIDNEATARENADATKADLTDLAADFSTSTAYAVGDYVTHAGDLFRCTTQHTAGDWNAGHFKRVKVGDELKAEATARQTADATLQTNIDNEATARQTADTNLQTNLLSVLGFDNSNVYYGINNSTSKNFNVSWKSTPLNLAVGDYVVLKFDETYTQDIQYVSLIVGNHSYNIDVKNGASNVNTINAGTTIIYKCTSSYNLTTHKIGRYDVIPKGMIVMWSGSSVPNGWALCDGTNGTPDLRNRFIVGSGDEYVIGAKDGKKSNTIGIGNLPAHSHIYVGDSNIPPHWIWNNSLNGFVVDASNEAGKKLYDKYGMEIYFPKDYDRGTWSISGSAWNRDTGTNWTNASQHNWSADGNGTARLYLSSSTIYAKGNRADTYGTSTPDAIENRPPYYALAFIMFKG